MRGTYETGPLGPETARTIREIEAENTHRVYDRNMPKMMPGQKQYTPDEYATLRALVRDAADSDPGERGETPVRVTWTCDECGERIRGFAGSIGVCSYCETWQDAPDETQPA